MILGPWTLVSTLACWHWFISVFVDLGLAACDFLGFSLTWGFSRVVFVFVFAKEFSRCVCMLWYCRM